MDDRFAPLVEFDKICPKCSKEFKCMSRICNGKAKNSCLCGKCFIDECIKHHGNGIITPCEITYRVADSL